ncbi:hypothetical protein [Limnovirga soli]|uniref:Outer membrane protein beta-barrel domain-containing protein n=1 Tax=Limnovirga soli TaxID=2656915 RepID=A0A8J8FCQ5_9BACT|nr:hypothetical protein [Limnovirga soli]NNV53954.1 hypothetical protein [Limnovirga soli]
MTEEQEPYKHIQEQLQKAQLPPEQQDWEAMSQLLDTAMPAGNGGGTGGGSQLLQRFAGWMGGGVVVLVITATVIWLSNTNQNTSSPATTNTSVVATEKMTDTAATIATTPNSQPAIPTTTADNNAIVTTDSPIAADNNTITRQVGGDQTLAPTTASAKPNTKAAAQSTANTVKQQHPKAPATTGNNNPSAKQVQVKNKTGKTAGAENTVSKEFNANPKNKTAINKVAQPAPSTQQDFASLLPDQLPADNNANNDKKEVPNNLASNTTNQLPPTAINKVQQDSIAVVQTVVYQNANQLSKGLLIADDDKVKDSISRQSTLAKQGNQKQSATLQPGKNILVPFQFGLQLSPIQFNSGIGTSPQFNVVPGLFAQVNFNKQFFAGINMQPYFKYNLGNSIIHKDSTVRIDSGRIELSTKQTIANSLSAFNLYGYAGYRFNQHISIQFGLGSDLVYARNITDIKRDFVNNQLQSEHRDRQSVSPRHNAYQQFARSAGFYNIYLYYHTGRFDVGAGYMQHINSWFNKSPQQPANINGQLQLSLRYRLFK